MENKIKENKPFGTNKLLGADFNTIKIHLENQFTKEMSWSKCPSFYI